MHPISSSCLCSPQHEALSGHSTSHHVGTWCPPLWFADMTLWCDMNASAAAPNTFLGWVIGVSSASSVYNISFSGRSRPVLCKKQMIYISYLNLTNLCPIPLPRLSEITRHKPKVACWLVWCFGPGRDGPTCILSWIVTTYIYSSEHESRKTYQVLSIIYSWYKCLSFCWVWFMAPVNSRDERAGEGRRGPGDPTHVHKFLMWEVKKVKGNSSLWCSVKR